MSNTPVEKERSVYIRELFFTICQRWRSLIICLLIGAIILGAYGWWTSGNGAISSYEQAKAYGKQLGTERKGVIEGYASDIYSSTQQIIRQGRYNRESLLMQLDPFHLYVYEVIYYIESDGAETNSSKRAALVLSYLTKLQDSFLGEKVTAVVEKDAYAEQKDYYESPHVIQVKKGDLEEGLLTFRFYYPEEQTEDVQELKTAMQTAKGQVSSELGEHELILIGESGFAYADLDILYIQEANTQRINDLATRIETIKKMVTNPDEQKYLNYILANPDAVVETTGKTEAIKADRHISKKHVVIGALLGLILAAVVIIIKYLVSDTIRSTKEVEEAFGLQVLGKVEGESPFYKRRNTKLDRWLRKKKNKTKGQIPADEMADVITTKIKIEAEKADLHQICLAIDKKVSGNAAFLDSLVEKVGDVPAITVIRNITEEPEGLEGMAGMDGAVIVGQIDRSGFDDLKNICELCRSYSVKVIGSIVVE